MKTTQYSLLAAVLLFQPVVAKAQTSTSPRPLNLEYGISLGDGSKVELSPPDQDAKFRNVDCKLLPQKFITPRGTKFQVAEKDAVSHQCYVATWNDQPISKKDLASAELLRDQPVSMAGMPDPRGALLLLVENPQVQAFIQTTMRPQIQALIHTTMAATATYLAQHAIRNTHIPMSLNFPLHVHKKPIPDNIEINPDRKSNETPIHIEPGSGTILLGGEKGPIVRLIPGVKVNISSNVSIGGKKVNLDDLDKARAIQREIVDANEEKSEGDSEPPSGESK